MGGNCTGRETWGVRDEFDDSGWGIWRTGPGWPAGSEGRDRGSWPGWPAGSEGRDRGSWPCRPARPERRDRRTGPGWPTRPEG